MKQTKKKANKNIFMNEVAMFEYMVKRANEGSYNHKKLLKELLKSG
jgi:hypothetical protein